MRFDRRVIELDDLVGGQVISTAYNEIVIRKDGRTYKVFFDLERGYYDDFTITCEITDVDQRLYDLQNKRRSDASLSPEQVNRIRADIKELKKLVGSAGQTT
jgi:hypothetical protein